MRRHADVLTGDMFAIPTPAQSDPGSLDFALAVRRVLADAVKHSQYRPVEIVARMSELLGHAITEHQLHAWTAPSRESWRFPLEYVAAFEVAAETYALTNWLASVRGGKLLVGREALDAELGRLERVRDDTSKRIRQIKVAMGDEA